MSRGSHEKGEIWVRGKQHQTQPFDASHVGLSTKNRVARYPATPDEVHVPAFGSGQLWGTVGGYVLTSEREGRFITYVLPGAWWVNRDTKNSQRSGSRHNGHAESERATA